MKIFTDNKLIRFDDLPLISFEDFLAQDDAYKYDMLQESESYSKYLYSTIKELERKLKQREKCRRKEQQFYCKQIFILKSILKEVREFCENNKEFTVRLNDILEILDKEN